MVAMVAALLASGLLTQSAGDSAFLAGGRVHIEPLGVSFALPLYWIDSTLRSKTPRNGCGSHSAPTLYVGPRDNGEEVAHATGEWDREYSTVADSVLPLRTLVAHVGSEGWGHRSQCFNDLQVRAYVLDLTPDDVVRRVQTSGVATADRFFSSRSFTGDSLGWRTVQLKWRAFYYDYGSEAHMEYFVRAYGTKTVVVLFMFADGASFGGANTTRQDMDAILSSWR